MQLCARFHAALLYRPIITGKNPEAMKCTRLDINVLHAVMMGAGVGAAVVAFKTENLFLCAPSSHIWTSASLHLCMGN